MKVVLLSGGMDSASLAWWKKPDVGVFINYGQKSARSEGQAAKAIAKQMSLVLEVINVDCSQVGGGSLAGRVQRTHAPTPEWWPYRNQLLLTIAAAKFASHSNTTLMIGSVVGDRKNGDGTPQFMKAVDRVFRLQPGNISVIAPASSLSAIQLINKSKVPFEVLRLSYSCHKGNEACGLCRGCAKQSRLWSMLSPRNHGRKRDIRL